MYRIEDLLSKPRLDPYVAATSGTTHDPLELYNWNSQVGAAFFESLHYVEVGLRNCIDRTRQRRLGADDWLFSRGGLLSRGSNDQVAIAQRRIKRAHRPVTHGRVIAELPFGFWWSLFAENYNRTLWQPALQYAFEGSVRRQRLHTELDHFRHLRNRIAHHEPIFDRDLHGDWSRLLDLAHRIGGVLQQRISQTTRVPATLAARPCQ